MSVKSYYLALKDQSPEGNPIYLRFEIGGHSDINTSMIYLLEKVDSKEVEDTSSPVVDTQHSNCPKALIRGGTPTNHSTDTCREIWIERRNSGRWETISDAEVHEDCVPDYIMHQILDGVEIQ